MEPTRRIFRRLTRRFTRDALTIFSFHGITAEPLPLRDFCFIDFATFRRQLGWIARSYRVLPLMDGLAALEAGTLRGPTAAITFDDGYQSAHDIARPLLRSMGLPATCFVVTGLLDSDRTAWFCRLHRALSETSHTAVSWREFRGGLVERRERRQTSHQLQELLKAVPGPALEGEVDAICRSLEVEPAPAVPPTSPYRMLSREAVFAMAADGTFTFGAHTVSHPILSLLDQPAQRREIEESVAAVRALPGAIDCFAYPNGGPRDYGDETKLLLSAAGITHALTTAGGRARRGGPALDLPRVLLGPGSGRAAVLD